MTQNYSKKVESIVRCILTYQKITREELTTELGIKKSTLTGYIDFLIGLKLIKETNIQTSSGGGRKPLYLELDPDYGYVLAVVIEKKRIISSLVNLKGELSYLEIHEDFSQLDKTSILSFLIDRAKYFKEKLDKSKYLGIGISLGGSVDSRIGVSHDNSYIKNWKDVPIAHIIEKAIDVKTIVIKDIESLALGEHYFGNGIGLENILSIHLGTDIGMGIIARRELYTGASSCSGELGHIIVDQNGPLCYCGRNGCLEKMVSVETLLEKCRMGLQQGVQSHVLNYINDDIDSLSVEHIIEASNRNDVFSRKLFRDIGEYIGMKLSEIVTLFNPEMVCLRGSLINNNIFLFKQIKDYIFSHSRSYNIKNLKLTFPEKEEHLKLKGTASIIFTKLPFLENKA
jgi:predicted NBD/HSP70 family sugar kinase